MSKRPGNFPLADLTDVSQVSIADRNNKTEIAAFGRPLPVDASMSDFFDSLPSFLKADDLKEFIERVARARRNDSPFHLFLGAHTIKVGLSPIIIDLMRTGIVTGLSFNGAGVIHDLELAFYGGTSEDVQAGLRDGSFGMVKETAQLFRDVSDLAAQETIGLGLASGRIINERGAKHRKMSVFGAAEELNLSTTVHVGIGTDIVSQHPEFDGGLVGAASHRDFRLLASICAAIDRGGVAANIGSTVLLPEVFLKALTVARNLNAGKSDLTTANFDMIEHYRPRVNMVTRPTFDSGAGFSFIGHHEIMIPLLAWGLKKACTGLNTN